MMIDDTLVAHDIRKVAVAAECDPRSVEAYLRGKTVRDLTRRRIVRALIELGYAKAAT